MIIYEIINHLHRLAVDESSTSHRPWVINFVLVLGTVSKLFYLLNIILFILVKVHFLNLISLVKMVVLDILNICWSQVENSVQFVVNTIIIKIKIIVQDLEFCLCSVLGCLCAKSSLI